MFHPTRDTIVDSIIDYPPLVDSETARQVIRDLYAIEVPLGMIERIWTHQQQIVDGRRMYPLVVLIAAIESTFEDGKSATS